MDKISLSEKFSSFTDLWNPRIIADLNEDQIKLVKVKGDFIWHHHENEDELFMVLKGKLLMDFRDHPDSTAIKTIEIKAGEIIVVPKGVEHRPHADDEVHVMLIEPKTVTNTGNEENELTRKVLERI